MFPKKNPTKNISKKFLKIFWIFRKLFVCFVLSKIFPEIVGAETICLVRKSSKSELSSRFFGRLKIFIGLGSLARWIANEMNCKWVVYNLFRRFFSIDRSKMKTKWKERNETNNRGNLHERPRRCLHPSFVLFRSFSFRFNWACSSNQRGPQRDFEAP